MARDLRTADLRLVAEAAESWAGDGDAVLAALFRVALTDLSVLHRRLDGRLGARAVVHAAGRIGEFALVARAIAEGETPLRAGRPGGSDLLAVDEAGQFVASDAKATTARRATSLPHSLSLARLGRAWSIDPATGEAIHALQGSIPYAGGDAGRMTLPIDAAENTAYRFLHVNFRAGEGRWGESDWYSVDIRRDPTRARLFAHDDVEPVHVSLGFHDGSLEGLRAATDAWGVDLA